MKIVVCKGVPASGKSTWAIAQCAKGGWARVNKDELRRMLHPDANDPMGYHWSKGNEKVIIAARDGAVRAALDRGQSVILDDTNIAPVHLERMRQIAAEYPGTTVEEKVFDVGLDEALVRDRDRKYAVGPKVIRKMFKDMYGTVDAFDPEPDPELPWAIICDLDGTLSLIHDRSPYDGKSCETDRLGEAVAEVLRRFSTDHDVILMSGRDDDAKPHTERWLAKHEIPYTHLYMRTTGDRRKDAEVKEELFNGYVLGVYNIRFVLDDRNQVVELWRRLGLRCFQVAPGDF